mmetsp:Transcript_17692/g.33666  ORF Transcript_17692/g.33666 Transcript_17692/m.33666 type:complete len:95 (+) Transcript_17692:704-988(+)
MAQLPHKDELPSSMMVKVGTRGTPWALILAPNQQKGGKMEVLFSGFRFDWTKVRNMFRRRLETMSKEQKRLEETRELGEVQRTCGQPKQEAKQT